MANGNPNYVAGYGDLSDPETTLYYKLYLAMTYRDQQLKNPNCSAAQLYGVIQNIGLLRAQLTALHDSNISLQAPTQSDINSLKTLTTKVEALTSSDADLAIGLGLLSQIVTQTTTLIAS
jgi:hypothetical protein